MAIAFDTAGAVGESFFGTTAVASITVGGGLSNSILYMIGTSDAAGTMGAPTVDASATGVVQIGSTITTPAGDKLAAFYLLAPSAGLRALSLTCAGASFCSICGVSYQGVDQTTPFGTPATANANSVGPVTVNVTTSVGDWVLDAVAFETGGGSRTLTVGAGQNQRANNSGNGIGLASSDEVAAGASTTMSWTISTSTDWAIMAMVMAAAAAGGGISTAEKMAAIAAHTASGGMYGRRWR